MHLILGSSPRSLAYAGADGPMPPSGSAQISNFFGGPATDIFFRSPSTGDGYILRITVTMAARPSVLRAAVRVGRPSCSYSSSSGSSSRHVRLFTTTIRNQRPEISSATPHSPGDHASRHNTTHFGFQDGISESEKTERVANVFRSVAESYDRMNDLMSFGWHRIWKYALLG